MVCVYCGGELAVKNSRPQKRNNQIWRRRQCLQCHALFTSHEAIEAKSSLMVQQPNGTLEGFAPDKLFTELLLALQSRKSCYEDAREVVSTVVNHLIRLPASPVFTTPDISRETAAVLKRLDKQAWMRYIAEHPSLL